MEKEKLKHKARVTFGADPELFVSNGENVVESAAALASMKVADIAFYDSFGRLQKMGKEVVQDGVQIELHPAPDPCRANFTNTLKAIIKNLATSLKKQGLQPVFDQVIQLSDVEMANLSEAARQLGCMPSCNAYRSDASIKVGADFRTRSAAGHIHLDYLQNQPQVKPQDLIKVLDIVVGIPMVMIDRDPMAAERRKTYGRAGEYRIPKYGIEYRTPSNFWLRAAPLASLMLALCRLSVNIAANKYSQITKVDHEAELLSLFDSKKVEEVINTNDFAGAMEHYQILKGYVTEYVDYDYYVLQDRSATGLDDQNIEDFQVFAETINQKGIGYWFPEDPITYWTTVYTEGHQCGWESFVAQTLKPKINEVKIANLMAYLAA